MEDTEKVYCVSCDHLERMVHTLKCTAPLNLTYTDSFFCREYFPIEKPEVLNANNNCGWWKQKVYDP